METEKKQTGRCAGEENTEHAGRAHLADLELVLQQITCIDRAGSVDEIRAAIQLLLQAIGNYTGADRAYIFEATENDARFSNSFEWCAAGVTSQIGNLQAIRAEEMPVWHRRFLEGACIVIEDLAQVRVEMPLEYEILKSQGIRAEIAFPVWHQHRLLGFIGLDNPRMERARPMVDLLSVVGSHMGNIWENFRVDAMLEKKREELQESRKALEKEQRCFEVLCRDYTSVYYLDLNDGTAEILKMDGLTNAAQFINIPRGQSAPYAPFLQLYIARYVTKESAEKLAENLALEHLRAALRSRDRVTYRYHSLPNAAGHQNFEVQVICVERTEASCKALMGFRHIDDILTEEQCQHDELARALAEAQLNSEIISAIGKIYVSIFHIDLERDLYEEISSNKRMHKLTGKQGKASTKMTEICNTFVRPEYYERVLQFFDLSTLAERLQNEETVALEYLDRTGNWQLARFIAKKRRADGTVNHVLYVTRSINESKRREQSWIAIAEEANRANAAKTDFISRMTHDIRTPLNAVRGFTKIAQEHAGDPARVKSALQKIDLAGRYLQQIVDDVLDMSQIEDGQMKLLPKSVSVKSIYEESTSALEGIQPDKHLHFDYRLHDIAHDYVLADELRIKQIYINLLSNAIKYTPQGGTVSFELYQEAIPGRERVRLVAVIRDNGIGMTQDFMDHMYAKFTRAVDTRVNKVSGSGLGLSIVKHLVDLMGGTIEVDSAVGKGTTFRIVLEVPYTGQPAGEKAHPPLEQDAAVCVGLHLLVAEDNALNYEVISDMLSGYRITCDRAEDGAACVEQFKSAPPYTYDAILMDVMMPVMDGLQATSAIRKLNHPQSSSIPIFALTANAFADDIHNCIAAGMNAHLAKPVNIPALLKTLASHCRRSEGRPRNAPESGNNDATLDDK